MGRADEVNNMNWFIMTGFLRDIDKIFNKIYIQSDVEDLYFERARSGR